jgi:alkylation response protein AidB-like acyl-CoA dehydrogenase
MIDLNLSADQRGILAAVGALLTERAPVARLRGPAAADADAALLPALAEIGVFGLGCPESVGGAGFSLLEDGPGRHRTRPASGHAPCPGRPTWGTCRAGARPDRARSRDHGGTCRVCLGQPLASGGPGLPEGLPLHLLDAREARLVVVWNDSGIGLLHAEALRAQAVEVQATDPSVLLQRCVVPAGALLGWVPAAQGALHRQAQLLVAAQLLGMAEASRDMAVDYAQVRMQFGQPIGAFQAVKHRCANMAIGAEALRAQLVLAAIAERDGWPDAAFQVDACRLLAARCALANAGANIQMHGGIGFTAECDAHLFLLRAHLLEHLGGPVRTLRERLAGIDTVSLSLEVP